MTRQLQISPSILSADFANLEAELRAIADADWAHVDVMDNHFVPNLTLGRPVVEALARVSPVPLDAHLMIADPDRWAPGYAEAGAASVTFHVEAAADPVALARAIRAEGARAAFALKPGTPFEPYEELLDEVDMVLVMSVNPGFGGQAYIEGSEGKVGKVRSLLDHGGFSDVDLQVDGGIDAETIGRVVSAGATVAVAGSAIFNGSGDVAGNLYRLRAAAAVERSPLRRL